MKSGTTWMQQILRQLLEIPREGSIDPISSWVELRQGSDEMYAKFESRTHRRILKHHLPKHCLPQSANELGTFIYIARDGRDVVHSCYIFYREYTADVYP